MTGHCPQCELGPYHRVGTGDSLRVEFQITKGALDGSPGDIRHRSSAGQDSGLLVHRGSGSVLG